MVRCWRLGNFLRETSGSPLIEKLSFLLPFFVITNHCRHSINRTRIENQRTLHNSSNDASFFPFTDRNNGNNGGDT